MASDEIQILIKAVDDTSATVKKIETTLTVMGKKVDASSSTTTESFQKQIGTLVSLGNAASSVDSIMDSFANLQLRLENATERVVGATERLTSAQDSLNNIQKNSAQYAIDIKKARLDQEIATSKLNAATMKYGSNSLEARQAALDLEQATITLGEAQTKQGEDTTKAQADIESATRGLTIAQNNLEKANNQVVGTYINIGVQSLSLVASLPQLGASILSMATWTWTHVAALVAQAAGLLAVTVAGFPLWVIILAIIAAVGLAILIFKNWDLIVKKLGEAFTWLKDNVLTPVWDFLKGIYNWIKDTFLSILEKIISTIQRVIDMASSVKGAVGNIAGKMLGSRATGGPINETGPYLLHEGEYVIPKNEVNKGGSSISVNIGNLYASDAESVASTLEDVMRKKLGG